MQYILDTINPEHWPAIRAVLGKGGMPVTQTQIANIAKISPLTYHQLESGTYKVRDSRRRDYYIKHVDAVLRNELQRKFG